MNPDGTEQREFARGLRNAVGLKWIGNFLWASNQGSDHLGLNRPDETFYALKDGADYGWPYCHSANGKIIAGPRNFAALKATRRRDTVCLFPVAQLDARL